MFNKKNSFNKKKLFWIYIIILFVFIAVKFKGSFYELVDRINSIKSNREEGIWNINMAPFRTMKPYLTNFFSMFAFKNILGNILPFIPFGFLLPIAYNKNFFQVLLISFIGIIFIEIFQLITMLGYCDIDDIILNLIGCMIGYGIFCCYQHCIRKEIY
ncbi:VanZ family protein [Anaerosalibacter bizertensis]|uniref:VanZ family protein n=1 Tax=Anaerosalibacter bizertensis TaxID=932217 RepID=UPI0035151AD6